MTDNVSPPWGHLPVEQYLLRNWDNSSPLTPSLQIKALVTKFLSLSTIPREWDVFTERHDGSTLDLHLPTPEEITTILVPWRPQSIRIVANTLCSNTSSCVDLTDDAVWVRTYYPSESHDAQESARKRWIKLLRSSDMFFHRDHISSLTLNDAGLFNFPDDVTPQEIVDKVLMLLPELATSTIEQDRYSRKTIAEMTKNSDWDMDERLRKELKEWVDYNPIPAVEGESASVEEWEKQVMNTYGVKKLQRAVMNRGFVVADKHMFDTGEPLFLMLDINGHIVRWARLDPGCAGFQEISGMDNRACVEESLYWDEEYYEQCGVGERYRLKGQYGGVLYGLGDVLSPKSEST
ncbi:hypothetical protein B0T21DRAFT_417021 [Apiosordaria backusii]|uniref:Uncharacterized protein n=1 Tax=Apiosordaria backusii TaxID=314023 RepID=A0AA39ZRW5_9PEZI|nr:hypothetical protein B0T21DRAFT_417021 [Apiosordaria backusii]